MRHLNEGILQSPPTPVEFLGWRSDTHTLQRHGWQFAMYLDQHTMWRTFLIQHKCLGLRGISDEYEYREQTLRERAHNMGPPIRINQITSGEFQVYRMETTYNLMEARQVDMTPQWNHNPTSMEVWEVFKTIPSEAETMMVDKADMSVVEHLQKVIEQQRPKQAELREKARKAEARKEKDVTNLSDVILQVAAA